MTNAFDPHHDDNWNGGYYEAAMVIGYRNASNADALLRTAICRLWSQPGLRAAALGDVNAWMLGESVSFDGLPLEALHRIYGEYGSPALGALPFTSVVVREEEGEDWLYACAPLGGIADSGGYPFGGRAELLASRRWREPLELELGGMALEICRAVPIRIAAIGFEVAGNVDIQQAALRDSGSRWEGYIVGESEGYRYWPTTRWY